jgi:hypothetical protein
MAMRLGDSPIEDSGHYLMRKLGGTAPFAGEKEVRSMRKADTGLANRVIERILELSADAQIERRKMAKDTPEFRNLAGAITAYGTALLRHPKQRTE